MLNHVRGLRLHTSSAPSVALPQKSFSTLNKASDSGVCEKNAGQLHWPKPRSPLHPPNPMLIMVMMSARSVQKKSWKLLNRQWHCYSTLDVGGGGAATNCIRLYVFQRFFCKHRYTHRVCLVCYMCAHVLAPEATPHVRLTRLTCKTWKILYVLHILHS